jgi:hypothetical protein
MSRAGTKLFPHKIVDWVVLPLAALLFHVLLFSLFTPTKSQNETLAKRSRFTLMLQADPVLQESDPYRLRYWMYYLDPEKMIKPDPECGFSLIRKRKRVRLSSPFHCPHGLYDQVCHISAYPEKILPSERGLDSLASYSSAWQNPRSKPVPGKAGIPIHYPLWVDHTGKKFSGFFLKDAASRKLFNRCAEKASGSTLLQLDTENGRIPVITVRRSCGIQELDFLAKRQLSAKREIYELSSGTGKKRSFYNVFWNQKSL